MMSESNAGTFSAKDRVYDNSNYAKRVRFYVGELNTVLKKAPDGVKVRLDILDMSTLSGREECINVTISQEI